MGTEEGIEAKLSQIEVELTELDGLLESDMCKSESEQSPEEIYNRTPPLSPPSPAFIHVSDREGTISPFSPPSWLTEAVGHDEVIDFNDVIGDGWLEVAVKLLKPGEGSLDELLVEAHVMSLLDHPNLVKMYGLTLRPSLGLIMEYLPESDLQHLLERNTKCRLLRDVTHEDLSDIVLVSKGSECVVSTLGRGDDKVYLEVAGGADIVAVPQDWVRFTFVPTRDEMISWRFRVRIAIDIARGLEYLHSLVPPVIHRDLRSPNIFLLSLDESAPVIAKVADFGLAAVSGAKLGKHLMTWQWLAPEVLSASRSGYDERSDVYSFGILLYEIATRKFPYLDDYSDRFRRGNSSVDQHSIVAAILRENLRPMVDPTPPSFCPSLVGWEKFCRLMSSCWATLPGKIRKMTDRKLLVERTSI